MCFRCVFRIQQIRIYFIFIRAALTIIFFVFRNSEIVPLPEVFAVILGFPVNALSANPSTPYEGRKMMGKFLRLNDDAINEMLRGDTVDLSILIKHIRISNENIT